VAAVRVPQFAVRLVMLAVLFLLTGVVAQVAPAAAAVRTGSPGTAASFAVSGYLCDVAATSGTVFGNCARASVQMPPTQAIPLRHVSSQVGERLRIRCSFAMHLPCRDENAARSQN
jgi:hypothetical protein